MRGVKFTKAVATGNDFIILDRARTKRGPGPGDLADFAKAVCERRRSVGADGLLVIERSKGADFRMRIFNPDGSEASMCGNGSRCAALYARRSGIVKKSHMRIETLAGILRAQVKGDVVRVRLTDPKDIRWNFCLTIRQCPYKVSFAHTGVPHVVHFVDDIDRIDVKSLGASMRYHEDFSPAGANVDFVEVVDGGAIKVRTYERGVEDETLACGTGVVASAVIAAESEKLKSPVIVYTKGAEKLKVFFDVADGEYRNVYLEGVARLAFEGELA